jgi:hypothetical protein
MTEPFNDILKSTPLPDELALPNQVRLDHDGAPSLPGLPRSIHFRVQPENSSVTELYCFLHLKLDWYVGVLKTV